MAQVIGYCQNDVIFEEGPFVIVNANGWRIECELKGHYCPVLPDSSIYKLREYWGYQPGKFREQREAEELCDRLNQAVKDGVIVLDGKSWVWKTGG